jgi:hypothetical protein
VHFVQASFFDLPVEDESDLFNFIYDYTFFCALEPTLRVEWAHKMFALLKRGGELCTLMYPIMPREGGPPYEVSLADYQTVLLQAGFKEVHIDIMLPDELCHAGRENKCALGRWRK